MRSKLTNRKSGNIGQTHDVNIANFDLKIKKTDEGIIKAKILYSFGPFQQSTLLFSKSIW